MKRTYKGFKIVTSHAPLLTYNVYWVDKLIGRYLTAKEAELEIDRIEAKRFYPRLYKNQAEIDSNKK